MPAYSLNEAFRFSLALRRAFYNCQPVFKSPGPLRHDGSCLWVRPKRFRIDVSAALWRRENGLYFVPQRCPACRKIFYFDQAGPAPVDPGGRCPYCGTPATFIMFGG